MTILCRSKRSFNKQLAGREPVSEFTPLREYAGGGASASIVPPHLVNSQVVIIRGTTTSSRNGAKSP